ncbi:MAG TPA: hypothetical protein VJB70_01190 [Candidatus Paceibacterota bacterium]
MTKKLFFGILLSEFGLKEGETMGLVDREELKKIRTRFESHQEHSNALFDIARERDGQSPYARCAARALSDLNRTLITAASEGKEVCQVLYLSGLAQYGFVIMSRTTDMEKLCNSPVLVKFFQILVEEGLRPFIKTISGSEALQGPLAEGNYIFVRLP